MRARGVSLIRRLIATAWREWQVTRQTSTGNGAKYIAHDGPPPWFKAEECGFGLFEGWDLLTNLHTLDERNALNRALLDQQEQPPVSRPLRTRSRDRLRRHRHIARRAGVAVVDGKIVDTRRVG